MRVYGVEDIDFGLKAWLMGYPVLHDPEPVIGHRFRASFDNYSVPMEHILVNQLRMARKNFSDPVWDEWVQRCRAPAGWAMGIGLEDLYGRARECGARASLPAGPPGA
jgi:GT2 family glycosyltransferase